METIQSMWIAKPGVPFSTMEKLCMKSFMANGHTFHLYLYDSVEGVPEGVILEDANDIIPRTVVDLFNYRAQFSDLFRYMLVYKKGGWWVDMDIVCLRPFVFDAEVVVSGADGCIHNSPFKTEPGNKWLGYALDLIQEKHDRWKVMDWSEIGGPLLTLAAKTIPMDVVDQFLFDPFQNSSGYERYILPDAPPYPEETYSLHLHHACWTLGLGGQVSLDPDATYPKSSIYETLKARYL